MSTPDHWQRDVFRDMGGPADTLASIPVVPPAQEGAAPQGAAPQGAAPQGASPGGPAGGPPHGPGVPAPAGPPPAPETVALVAPGVSKHSARHGDPVPRRTARLLRRVLSPSAARDTEAASRRAAAIQQPVTTGRQIAVSSVAGGAGKSTVSALLAFAFGHYRSDPVVAVEADATMGTLPRRLGATELRWSCDSLASVLHPSMRLTDVTGYLVPYRDGWLLPGSRGELGAYIAPQHYQAVITSLRRYFATTVIDCETLPAELARIALSTTQARVLAVPATVSGLVAARSVLEWLGGLHRSLLPTTVVALTSTSPDMELDTARARKYLSDSVPVVPIPYDRTLAPGGAIDTRRLGEQTTAAAAELAATAMNLAMSRERGARHPDEAAVSGPRKPGPGAPPAPTPAGYAPPPGGYGPGTPQSAPGSGAPGAAGGAAYPQGTGPQGTGPQGGGPEGGGPHGTSTGPQGGGATQHPAPQHPAPTHPAPQHPAPHHPAPQQPAPTQPGPQQPGPYGSPGGGQPGSFGPPPGGGH